MLHRYSHIVWDWNGTILDDIDLLVDITNQQLSEAGLPILNREQYRRDFSHPVSDFYTRLGFDLSTRSFADIGADFHRRYATLRHGVTLHNGAKNVLGKITSSGKTQSVLSAHQQEMLNYIVGHHGLSGHFSEICGLKEYTANSKLELGKEWLATKEFKKESVVMIGDTDHDYEVANALGIDCILVSHGLQSHERLLRLGVPVIEGLEELIGA